MRRVSGLVLSALGTFLIVLALLTKFVVAGEAVKFPLNENTITTLTAQNAKYFSPSLLTAQTGVTLEDTLTTQGDNAAGNSGTAVWNQFNYVYDRTNFQTVSYSTDRYAFDRKSGELSNCCGASLGYQREGALLRAGPGLAAEHPEADVSGLQHDADEDGACRLLRHRECAGHEHLQVRRDGAADKDRHAGGARLTHRSAQRGFGHAARVFAGTTTEWVDPVTGAPVKGVSSQHQYLADASGNEVLTLIDATFSTSPGQRGQHAPHGQELRQPDQSGPGRPPAHRRHRRRHPAPHGPGAVLHLPAPGCRVRGRARGR